MNVFYSWQSWLSTNTNRNFIQRAIEKAINNVVQEEELLKLDFALDKDTENVTGSPDIAETIFAKIRECEVFIGDITPVTVDNNQNKIPNPNVLVELGYAASELGWERIICILNTAYGNIEQLPFDIRQQRIATYHLTEEIDNEERSKQSKLLSSAISASLRSIKSRFLPDVEYLNAQIVHPVYPLRICIPIILWAFERTDEGSEEETFVFMLLQRLIDDADEAAKNNLPQILVEKSHALTSRQQKRCREITQVTREIASKVGFYLMSWDMYSTRTQRSQERNTDPQYSRRDYMSSAISLLKTLYETKWLQVFESLDRKYVPGPDDYLFDKKPISESQKQKMRDKLYELQGNNFGSREEFDKALERDTEAEFDWSQMIARASIGSAYRDKKLADLVWDFISQLKES